MVEWILVNDVDFFVTDKNEKEFLRDVLESYKKLEFQLMKLYWISQNKGSCKILHK